MYRLPKQSHLRCAQVNLLIVGRPGATGNHLLRVRGRQQRRPVPLTRHRTHQNETILMWKKVQLWIIGGEIKKSSQLPNIDKIWRSQLYDSVKVVQ